MVHLKCVAVHENNCIESPFSRLTTVKKGDSPWLEQFMLLAATCMITKSRDNVSSVFVVAIYYRGELFKSHCLSNTICINV